MTVHLNIPDAESRACVICNEIKSASEFYHRETGRLRRDCKECQLTKNATYQQSDSGKKSMARSNKKYRASGRHAENNRRWRWRNPAKWKASGILAYRIKTGKVARPDHCDNCGAVCVPHGHHCDYSKPLDVDWLCAPCHFAWHAKHGIEGLPR